MRLKTNNPTIIYDTILFDKILENVSVDTETAIGMKENTLKQARAEVCKATLFDLDCSSIF